MELTSQTTSTNDTTQKNRKHVGLGTRKAFQYISVFLKGFPGENQD